MVKEYDSSKYLFSIKKLIELTYWDDTSIIWTLLSSVQGVDTRVHESGFVVP